MTNENQASTELRAIRSAWWALERQWSLCPVERQRLLPAGGQDDDFVPAGTETGTRILIEMVCRITLAGRLLHEWLRGLSPTLSRLTPLDAMSGPLRDLRGPRRLVDTEFAS